MTCYAGGEPANPPRGMAVGMPGSLWGTVKLGEGGHTRRYLGIQGPLGVRMALG